MDENPDDERRITRRRLLAGVGVAGASTAALTVSAPEAEAEVALGNLSVDGATATLDSPPAAVDLSVSGEFEVESNALPEMCESTLQVEYDGDTNELGTEAAYDTRAGSFAFSEVNILEHENLTADALTPDTAGATQTTDVTIRVVTGVVIDGSLEAESYVEDTATLTVTKAGVKVALGGSGSLSFEA